MPTANPLSDSGMTSSASFTSSYRSPGQVSVGGQTNLTVAAMVGVSLLIILAFHIAGFRFAFDVSVGRH